jgi:hypothetical protein
MQRSGISRTKCMEPVLGSGCVDGSLTLSTMLGHTHCHSSLSSAGDTHHRHKHTHTHLNVHIHLFQLLNTCAYTHPYCTSTSAQYTHTTLCTHVHTATTHMHPHLHDNKHAYTHPHLHVHTHPCSDTHSHKHTCVHTLACAHTKTHVCYTRVHALATLPGATALQRPLVPTPLGFCTHGSCPGSEELMETQTLSNYPLFLTQCWVPCMIQVPTAPTLLLPSKWPFVKQLCPTLHLFN